MFLKVEIADHLLYFLIQVVFFYCLLPVILPPPVSNKSNNGKRCKSEVKYPRVHTLCWFFTKLLCGFSTDRALGTGVNSEKCPDSYREVNSEN